MFSTRRQAFCAVLLLASTLALGCRRAPLWRDGFFEGMSRSPPSDLFSVEWWRQLVHRPFLEYAPRERAGPAIDTDTRRLIAGTRDGWVRAVNPAGEVEWEFKTQGPFNAAPTVKDGVAYVAGGDGVLYALRTSTGQLSWKYVAGEELATSPVVTSDRVLFASQADTLFALARESGEWKWQYRRDTPSGFTIRGASGPKVASGVAYVGFSDGAVVALDVADGSVKWQRSLSGGTGAFFDVDTTPVLDDAGRLYVASYKEGVFALDPETGANLWHSPLHGVVGLFARSDVLFATGSDEVVALLSDNGRVLWKLPLKGNAGNSVTFAAGHLIVPADQMLLFVDPAEGTVRTAWDPGDGVSAPVLVSESRLYVLSNLGFLYSLSMPGGSTF